MKHVLTVVFVCFALSLCNLSERLHGGGSTNSSGSTTSGGGAAERPQPTAAQTAALAGGKEAKWERQGMSWTVPPQWTENENESKSFMWRSPGGSDAASLIVSISPMDESFPVDASLDGYFESAKSRAKNGEVDEVKWVELDGLKGVQFREANPEKPDGHRRLQWLAYRKYLGQLQMISLMLATPGADFPRHQDAMYGILYSTKVTH
jgi:hypothetical protein